jgi:hypothetical protein
MMGYSKNFTKVEGGNVDFFFYLLYTYLFSTLILKSQKLLPIIFVWPI